MKATKVDLKFINGYLVMHLNRKIRRILTLKYYLVKFSIEVCDCVQRVDRQWSAVGAAGVQHASHSSGCGQLAGGARTSPAAEAGA